ncbi:MAG: OmpA family protein [Bacteroidota bacterium]
MKQKILSYLFVCTLFVAHLSAQDEVKRANDLFHRTYYMDAIPLYEEALLHHRSQPLVHNLADCYYHTFAMEKAAKWYQYLIDTYQASDPLLYFRLSEALKAMGNLEEAYKTLRDHYIATGSNEKLSELTDIVTYLDNVAAIGKRFAIDPLALNTSNSEFGAQQIGNELWYTATKKAENAKTYRWNNQQYLDLYTHPMDSLHMDDSVSRSLSTAINTRLHEGAFALSPDGKTLYFTRNNLKKGKRQTDEHKISNLKIYTAKLEGNQWTNVTALPFNSDSFSNEHPALNPEGTQLYFASDRPGGFGGFDLYSVSIGPNDTYGPPTNLGPNINTDKKEQFPFIGADHTLYFSSNGHPGFGSLDVFKSTPQGGVFQKPDNLGLPLNGGFDDFSFVIDKAGVNGYFASNRPTGKGSDDLYQFKITKPLLIEDCQQYIAGTITDRTTTTPLEAALITLLDGEGNQIDSLKTSSSGSFKFPVACGQKYTVKAQKEGYEDNEKILFTDKVRQATKDASMTLYADEERQKAEQLALEAKQEAEKRRVEEEKRIAAAEVAKKKKEAQIAADLLAKRQQEAEEQAKREKAKKIEAIIAADDRIEKKEDRTLLKTPEIHFDYGMWYLRRETRERLGQVVVTLKENPSIVIEIGSHTDIRGSSTSNRELSQRRADAAKEFIVKQGIAAERVIAKGYGESEPIVTCPKTVTCTEEDHEWNRRCEFEVVRWDYQPKNKVSEPLR